MLKPILFATLVAGTLDILSAFLFAGMAGASVMDVLKFVASGPFPAAEATPGWAAIGLAVHYAIMACMVTAWFLIAARKPHLVDMPIRAGIAYGVVLWGIMYWIVRPLRWPDLPLPHSLWGISNALFSHCVLVGIPIALIAARHFRRRRGAFA